MAAARFAQDPLTVLLKLYQAAAVETSLANFSTQRTA
jgi:hypothetical protein